MRAARAPASLHYQRYITTARRGSASYLCKNYRGRRRERRSGRAAAASSRLFV